MKTLDIPLRETVFEHKSKGRDLVRYKMIDGKKKYYFGRLLYDHFSMYAVSIQAGCPVRCSFCFNDWFNGNLSAEQIINQVESLYVPVDHYTELCVLGGEPFYNFKNVYKAYNHIKNTKGFNGGLITVCPTLFSIKDYEDVFKNNFLHTFTSFGVSVHGDHLMPFRKRHNIKTVVEIFKRYKDITGETPFFQTNYTNIQEILDNVSPEDGIVRVIRMGDTGVGFGSHTINEMKSGVKILEREGYTVHAVPLTGTDAEGAFWASR